MNRRATLEPKSLLKEAPQKSAGVYPASSHGSPGIHARARKAASRIAAYGDGTAVSSTTTASSVPSTFEVPTTIVSPPLRPNEVSISAREAGGAVG
jgi:hypothetical protein